MDLRITSRTNKDGSQAACVQLAHTRRDPRTHTPQAEILFNKVMGIAAPPRFEQIEAKARRTASAKATT